MSNNQTPHPLESVFDMSPSTVFKEPEVIQLSERERSLIDPTSGEVVVRSVNPASAELEKEERLEDLHIDGQLESIHDSAMVAFEKQIRMADEVDPKFAARNAEVAAQYLNLALSAVNSRVDAKFKRQKVRLAKQEALSTAPVSEDGQGTIVIDRNEMLKAILSKRAEKTIDL